MPTKSRFGDIEIPPVDIWTLIFERDIEFPSEKPIYTDPASKRSYSYGDVKSTAEDFGKGLKVMWGWKPKDLLLLCLPNAIETPIITWGTLWAGGIISPANPGYNPNELAVQLRESGAKGIVTRRDVLKLVLTAARLAGIPQNRIILVGEESISDVEHFAHVCERGKIEGQSLQRTVPNDPKNDLAFLVYSSGTSGNPKGVMLSHENIVSNMLMLKESEGVNLSWQGRYDNRGDRILGFLPFYHIYGLTSLVHQAILNGVELIVMDKFNLERFCYYIQQYKVTMAYVVPPVVLQLAKSPIVADFNLSSLRMLSSGAAPLTKELVDEVYHRLNVPIKQAYGLSETSPTTHSQSWDSWYKSVGSVGLLLPNQYIKFVGPDEKEVPIGEAGEILIKGPNVFKGYFKNLEATKNSLTDDGYFKTGDVGYEDNEGNLYITDRVKELIKYKGFQVAPAELEGLLLSHPDVEDAAVIGVYAADKATELPMAFVVVSNGVSTDDKTAHQLMNWINLKVAHHKHLRGGIRWVDTIPKSPSGKILRRVLKAKLERKTYKGPML